jgi:hypothetical protein
MWYLITVILVCLAGYLYLGKTSEAPGQNTSSGIISYSKQSLDSLHTNGFVTLEDSEIKQKLEVHGSLKAIRAKIGSLKVNGYANLLQSTIRSDSQINGFLNAVNSTFNGPLKVASQGVELQDCQLQSIAIEDASWILGSQTLELKGKTKVLGSITFESGKGTLIMSPESSIKGQVIGAQIKK